MARRHERKVKSLRGYRRHGKGNVKNKRGAGNKGGRGRAGLKKQKWTSIAHKKDEYFGKHGFVRPKKKMVPSINLWEINNYIKRGALDKEGDAYVFNFAGKVLGSGFISSPVIVRALGFTEKAKEKIEAAGGKAEPLKK